MRKFGLYLFCLVLVACSASKSSKQKLGSGKISFEEVSYGTYQIGPKIVEESPNTPSGTNSIIDGVKLIKETDTIVGKLGNVFGVEFKFESDVDKNIQLLKVWTFPNITNDKGESYTRLEREVSLSTNYKSFTTYEFEKEFEIVPGDWRLRFYYKGKLIYDRTFVVIR